MEFMFEVIAWFVLIVVLLFILWKFYLLVTWNIERLVFLGSVSHYLREDASKQKSPTGKSS